MSEASGDASVEVRLDPRLVLVGTPIGNRGDLSPRAAEAIRSADLLLCEDTRSPVRLLGTTDGLPERVSCFVGNEHRRGELLLERLARGQRVVFVSEAGMPVWSDPGATLVREAAAAGYTVEVIPGPSAASTALALSGFEATWACFAGFVERGGSERTRALERVATASGPTILFEAGNRLPALLRDLGSAVSDAATREVVICRELTKRHEEVRRGTIASLAAAISEAARGEVTVVIAGAPASVQAAAETAGQDGAREIFELLTDPTLKPRARARAVAARLGRPAREIYDVLTGMRARADEREDRADEHED